MAYSIFKGSRGTTIVCSKSAGADTFDVYIFAGDDGDNEKDLDPVGIIRGAPNVPRALDMAEGYIQGYFSRKESL